MRALILSAGLGERLRPLTLTRAKPAIDFLNVPMLGYPYHWLSRLGLTDVVFNTHHLPDTVRHAAMHVVPPETRIHFSHEHEILGSGGGIWSARFDLMNDATFAVANADGVVLHPDRDLLRHMLDEHLHRQALATLLVCPLDGVGVRLPGVWLRADGRVAGFGKSPPAPDTTCLHYASYMLLDQELWAILPSGPSNILYDVLEPQIKKGVNVVAYRADHLKWFETGNVIDYLSATKFCLEQIRENSVIGRSALDIVEHLGPPYRQRSRLDQLHLIADSAEIDPSAKLEGFVVVGEKARIEANTRLTDTVVLQDAVARAGQAFNQTVIN